MRNNVGHKIRAARLRVKPKITQGQLAAKLQTQDWEIDRSGVSKIEGGVREVNDIELVKIGKALGVKVGWLVGEVGDKDMLTGRK